jgi:hypothetical protein
MEEFLYIVIYFCIVWVALFILFIVRAGDGKKLRRQSTSLIFFIYIKGYRLMSTARRWDILKGAAAAAMAPRPAFVPTPPQPIFVLCRRPEQQPIPYSNRLPAPRPILARTAASKGEAFQCG